MRCTQFIGLSKRAEDWLKKHADLNSKTQYADASHWGMFDDGPVLHKYLLNGIAKLEVIYEVVQCVPWSSGPCIFLTLSFQPETEKWQSGLDCFDWTDEEISNI